MSKLLALATTGGQCGIPELASLKKSLLGSLHAEPLDLGSDDDDWNEEEGEDGHHGGRGDDASHSYEDEEPEDSSAYESEIQPMPEGPEIPKPRVINHFIQFSLHGYKVYI